MASTCSHLFTRDRQDEDNKKDSIAYAAGNEEMAPNPYLADHHIRSPPFRRTLQTPHNFSAANASLQYTQQVEPKNTLQ